MVVDVSIRRESFIGNGVVVAKRVLVLEAPFTEKVARLPAAWRARSWTVGAGGAAMVDGESERLGKGGARPGR